MKHTWLWNGKKGHAVTGTITSQSERYYTVVVESYESKSEKKLMGKSILVKKLTANDSVVENKVY